MITPRAICRICRHIVEEGGHQGDIVFENEPGSVDCLDCLEGARAGFLPRCELLRPVGREFPDGKAFLVEGKAWGYRFNTLAKWVACGKSEMGQHGGYDLVCSVGTPIRAPAAGKIFHAGWQDVEDHKRGWGLHIKLECGMPINDTKQRPILPWLTLAHCSELLVKEGDTVNRGQIIAYSGETGHALGAHLHAQLEEPGDWPRTPLRIKWVL